MNPEKNTLHREVTRKKRWRMIAVNGLAVSGAVVLFTLLGFVNKRQEHSLCRKLEVVIHSSNEVPFLEENELRDLVLSTQDSLIGQPLQKIDIAKITRSLASVSAAGKTNISTTLDGRLLVEVTERVPMARVWNRDGSNFYLDQDGYCMRLSQGHTAHVPVLAGQVSEAFRAGSVAHLDSLEARRTYLDDLYTIVKFLQGNAFWAAQVEHIAVNNQGEIELIPRVGNHRILIGNTEHLEMKFRKLMTFYANTLHTSNLNDFTIIDLQYANQVVCTRHPG